MEVGTCSTRKDGEKENMDEEISMVLLYLYLKLNLKFSAFT